MSDHLGRLTAIGTTLWAEVRPHDYVKPKRRRDATGHLTQDPFCERCGYHRLAAVDNLRVHPDEQP